METVLTPFLEADVDNHIDEGVANHFDGLCQRVSQLVIDTANPSQLDGAAPDNGQGVLRAVTGDLEVASNVTTVFNGVLEVGSTRTFTMSQPGSRFRNAPASEDDDGTGDFGRITLTRGTLVAETFEQASQLTSISISTLDVSNITFESGSLTEIVPNPTNVLQLDGATTIEAGATFAGGGTLRNLPGSSLILLDGADLDAVHLRNDGNFEIGASVGAATVDSYEQSSLLTATWTVEIGGTAPGAQYDQLIVTNDAQLDGAIVVELIDLGAGLFAPALADTFEVLVADSVDGVFTNEALPPLAAGLGWDVIYNPGSVVLQVVEAAFFSADFDEDGDVDDDDLIVWEGAFGVNALADADGDGVSDGHDFLQWQRQFGSGVSVVEAGSPMVVPEPVSMRITLIALSLALLVARSGSMTNRD